MTPEALRDYLITRRVDEDIVQDVLVDYLAAPPGSIRYPKSWAWRAAQNQAIDRARREARESTREYATHEVSTEPGALRVAIGKQELARALKRGPAGRRFLRYRQAREDAKALRSLSRT